MPVARVAEDVPPAPPESPEEAGEALGSRLSPAGLAAQAAVTATTATAAATVTHLLARRNFITFTTRSFTPVSPKARGLGAGNRRLLPMDSRDRLYSRRASSPSWERTFSSQLISMSRLIRWKASHTRGLNQWMASSKNPRGLMR